MENAVKHGLMHKGTGGLLKIVIQRWADDLKLTIEDNGKEEQKQPGSATQRAKA